MEPSVFIIVDTKPECQAFINEVFPNTTLLLCIFHVLQTLWRLLCESKHDVSKLKKQIICAKILQNFDVFKLYFIIIFKLNYKSKSIVTYF